MSASLPTLFLPSWCFLVGNEDGFVMQFASCCFQSNHLGFWFLHYFELPRVVLDDLLVFAFYKEHTQMWCIIMYPNNELIAKEEISELLSLCSFLGRFAGILDRSNMLGWFLWPVFWADPLGLLVRATYSHQYNVWVPVSSCRNLDTLKHSPLWAVNRNHNDNNDTEFEDKWKSNCRAKPEICKDKQILKHFSVRIF